MAGDMVGLERGAIAATDMVGSGIPTDQVANAEARLQAFERAETTSTKFVDPAELGITASDNGVSAERGRLALERERLALLAEKELPQAMANLENGVGGAAETVELLRRRITEGMFAREKASVDDLGYTSEYLALSLAGIVVDRGTKLSMSKLADLCMESQKGENRTGLFDRVVDLTEGILLRKKRKLGFKPDDGRFGKDSDTWDRLTTAWMDVHEGVVPSPFPIEL